MSPCSTGVKVVYIMYTGCSIIAGTDEDELRNIVSCIKAAGLNITEELYIYIYLRLTGGQHRQGGR